jgi:hypothetical protein
MNIYQEAADKATEGQGGEFSDRKLWTAVLLQALQDWQGANARRRSEAEKFFFQSPEDFNLVCSGAGLIPNSVLSRLRRMKETAAPRRVFHWPLAA